jgi:Flp pilus assembly protein TadD
MPPGRIAPVPFRWLLIGCLTLELGFTPRFVGTAIGDALGPLDRAVLAIATERYAQARAELTILVDQDPSDLEARGLLALALYLSGDGLAASRQVVNLRRQDPSGRETGYLVSRHFIARGVLLAPVLSLLARAGDEGVLWLAQVYQDRGLHAEAVTIARFGLQGYPTSVRLLDGLGFNAWKAGNVDEAVSAYRRAIDISPRTWGLHYNLGWIYYSIHRSLAATQEWKRAYALRPDPDLLQWIQTVESSR